MKIETNTREDFEKQNVFLDESNINEIHGINANKKTTL